MKRSSVLTVIIALLILAGCKKQEKYEAYLFAYFTGNTAGDEAIHFAVSEDGLNFRALNNNKAIIASDTISETGGVRDPHIIRCADGKTFYMVLTDLYASKMGWTNYAMVLMKSTDLINWESSIVNIPKRFPEKFGDVNRVWAPETIYDEETGKYMIYFSMKQGDDPDKIYYAYANEDFTDLETLPEQLFYCPTNNACIDANLIKKDGKFYLFHKSETGDPGIKLAISDKLTEGYEMPTLSRVDMEDDNVEGCDMYKLNNSDEWILMYDIYMLRSYQFTKTKDFKHFEIIDDQVSMNFRPRHGYVISITREEYRRLFDKWGTTTDPLIEATSKSIKKINIVQDGVKKTIHLPVKKGTDLSNFDPEFSAYSWTDISPKGPRDFTKGPQTYKVTIDGKGEFDYAVSASEDHNPVIEGYYADPEILYSEKTGKYYIYPTSDGFYKWVGYYFKVFSSDNLVDWTDEDTILNLRTDVTWAEKKGWAPSIIEKKVNGEYKYYFYYAAESKIGVAVADDPTGPFVDLGKPLIDWKPEGINRGQEIDADVFQDPVSGKYYLYWGNRYLAGAELNDDMVSIKKETLHVFNTPETYSEGTYVIFRNGTYYFLYSEEDTRSPDYKVCYATSDKPLGKLKFPEHNLVINKKEDAGAGIYATGHNSVIQIPGTDEWYIVYHRFTYPKGLAMGRFAGFHREVCIDKMNFDENGNILEVIPTLEGIKRLKTE